MAECYPVAVLSGPAIVAAIVAAVLGAMSACAPGAFACEGNDQCVDGSKQGTCEATGFCSFADVACPSMRRYGELAGDGLAGECVGDDGSTSDASTSIATTASTTTTTTVTTSATDSSSTGPDPIESEGPRDPYGPCETSMDCIDPTAVCVTNGNNRMCAPTCSAEGVPSAECPVDVDGDAAGVGCLYTDAEQTILRCFAVCDTIEDCPAGMTCVMPVCTWEG
jgi:hypothetical protein